MEDELSAEDYVYRLFDQTRDGAIERAKWIHENSPQFSAGSLHHGGEETMILYDDAQLSYIYGIFTGTIVLGQAYIENGVCGFVYSAGEFEQGDRPSYHDAVDFLEEHDLLEPDDVEGVPLDELHDVRNPLTHFRPVSDESRLSQRKIEEIRASENPREARTSAEILADDAQEVLLTMYSVSRLFGVGSEI